MCLQVTAKVHCFPVFVETLWSVTVYGINSVFCG